MVWYNCESWDMWNCTLFVNFYNIVHVRYMNMIILLYCMMYVILSGIVTWSYQYIVVVYWYKIALSLLSTRYLQVSIDRPHLEDKWSSLQIQGWASSFGLPEFSFHLCPQSRLRLVVVSISSLVWDCIPSCLDLWLNFRCFGTLTFRI